MQKFNTSIIIFLNNSKNIKVKSPCELLKIHNRVICAGFTSLANTYAKANCRNYEFQKVATTEMLSITSGLFIIKYSNC